MHRSLSRFLAVMAAFAVVGLVNGRPAEAVPFTISAQLTGDFRSDHPDNLFVNVTITGDTTSNVAFWLVDLNSPAHPSARLTAFALNFSTGNFVSFSNFAPPDWSSSVTSGDDVQGSDGADFQFAITDPPGSSNDVTNAQTLSFRTTLLSGTWSEATFLAAPLSAGGAIPNPGAQLGAYIEGLSTSGCSGCSADGFASGNYSSGTATSAVPEPASLTLLGFGLAGIGVRRWRQRRSR